MGTYLIDMHNYSADCLIIKRTEEAVMGIVVYKCAGILPDDMYLGSPWRNSLIKLNMMTVPIRLPYS